MAGPYILASMYSKEEWMHHCEPFYFADPTQDNQFLHSYLGWCTYTTDQLVIDSPTENS